MLMLRPAGILFVNCAQRDARTAKRVVCLSAAGCVRPRISLSSLVLQPAGVFTRSVLLCMVAAGRAHRFYLLVESVFSVTATAVIPGPSHILAGHHRVLSIAHGPCMSLLPLTPLSLCSCTAIQQDGQRKARLPLYSYAG